MFQFLIKRLSGNIEYQLKICAGTISEASPNVTRWGLPSKERREYLPANDCKIDEIVPDGEELTAGMLAGAGCAIIFLILACVGFVVWR